MKKLFISILTANSLSFSFYKFQGPFIIQAQPIPYPAGGSLTKKNIILQEKVICFTPEDILNHKAGPYDIPILFDPVTKFYIITTPIAHNLVSTTPKKINFICLNSTDTVAQVNIPNGKDPIYDFLKCNFEYDPENFWKLKNLTQYESITSGRNVGPLLFGRTNREKSLSSTQYLNALQYEFSPTNINWHCKEIIRLSHVSINYRKEFITYYSKKTSEKYPLFYNNQEHIPSYQQPRLEDFKMNPIRLREKIPINSNNIEIFNQKDGVKLYKNDQHGKTIKQIDLKSALLNYYNTNNCIEIEFATRLGMDKKRYKNFDIHANTMAWAATQFDRPILQPHNYELLENSTILAVWTVRADTFKPKKSKRYLYKEDREQQKKSLFADKPVHTIMIGLAKDNRTGELFHWVTDLERDLEALFSLESSRKSEEEPVNVNQYILPKYKDTQTDTLDLTSQ